MTGNFAYNASLYTESIQAGFVYHYQLNRNSNKNPNIPSEDYEHNYTS